MPSNWRNRPRPSEKSLEQGRSYNRRNREKRSKGYRPKKSAHAAIQRVRQAILEGKTYVIDFDLRSYFDTVKHHIVLEKMARRIDDDAVLWLLKLLPDASGKQGVPQGGVISPLISNVYLNEVDKMLERAKEVTRYERWTALEYARFADDRAPRAQRGPKGPRSV